MNYIKEEINRIDWYPEGNETRFIKENLPLFKESRLNNFNTLSFYKNLGTDTVVNHKADRFGGEKYTEFHSSYCITGPGGCGKTNLMLTYAISQNGNLNFGSKIKTIDDIDFSGDIVMIDALNEIENSGIIKNLVRICSKNKKTLVCSIRNDLGIDLGVLGFKKIIEFKSEINWSRITTKKKKYQALFIKELTPNIRDIKLFCYILNKRIGKNTQEHNFFMDVRNTIEQYFVSKGTRNIWNKLKEKDGSSKLTGAELETLSAIGFPSQRFEGKIIIDNSFFENLVIKPINYIRGISKYHEYASYIDWAKSTDKNAGQINDVQSAMLCNVHNNETEFKGVNDFSYIPHEILPFLRGDINLIKETFFRKLLNRLKSVWKYQSIAYQPAFGFNSEEDNSIGNFLSYLSNDYGNRYIFGSIIYKQNFKEIFKYSAKINDFYIFSAVSYLIRFRSIKTNTWNKIEIDNEAFKETFSYLSSIHKYFRNQPREGLMADLTNKYSHDEPYERIVPDSFSNETIAIIDHSLFHYSESIGEKSFERDIFYKWLKIKFPNVAHEMNNSDSVPTQTPYKCGLNDEELLIMDTFQYEYSVECDFKESNKYLRFASQYTEWSSEAIEAKNNRLEPIFFENQKDVLANFRQALSKFWNLIESDDVVFYDSRMIDNFNCFADVSFTLGDTKNFNEDYEYEVYEGKKYAQKKGGHELEQHQDAPTTLWTGDSYNIEDIEYFISPFCDFAKTKQKFRLSLNKANLWLMDGTFYFALSIDNQSQISIDVESSEANRRIYKRVNPNEIEKIFSEFYNKSI